MEGRQLLKHHKTKQRQQIYETELAAQNTNAYSDEVMVRLKNSILSILAIHIFSITKVKKKLS